MKINVRFWGNKPLWAKFFLSLDDAAAAAGGVFAGGWLHSKL